MYQPAPSLASACHLTACGMSDPSSIARIAVPSFGAVFIDRQGHGCADCLGAAASMSRKMCHSDCPLPSSGPCESAAFRPASIISFVGHPAVTSRLTRLDSMAAHHAQYIASVAFQNLASGFPDRAASNASRSILLFMPHLACPACPPRGRPGSAGGRPCGWAGGRLRSGRRGCRGCAAARGLGSRR